MEFWFNFCQLLSSLKPFSLIKVAAFFLSFLSFWILKWIDWFLQVNSAVEHKPEWCEWVAQTDRRIESYCIIQVNLSSYWRLTTFLNWLTMSHGYGCHMWLWILAPGYFHSFIHRFETCFWYFILCFYLPSQNTNYQN